MQRPFYFRPLLLDAVRRIFCDGSCTVLPCAESAGAAPAAQPRQTVAPDFDRDDRYRIVKPLAAELHTHAPDPTLTYYDRKQREDCPYLYGG